MDTNPWKEGFAAGRLDKSPDICPYSDTEVWEWICGYLDGRAKRLRLVTDTRCIDSLDGKVAAGGIAARAISAISPA